MTRKTKEFIAKQLEDLRAGLEVQDEDAVYGRNAVMWLLERHDEQATRAEAAEKEIERIKNLYHEWGFADAPCPKHSKPSILMVNCAVCRAEAAEKEVERLEGELDAALEAELKLAGLGVESTARAELAEKERDALTALTEKIKEVVREWARTHTNTYIGLVDRCALDAILDNEEAPEEVPVVSFQERLKRKKRASILKDLEE